MVHRKTAQVKRSKIIREYPDEFINEYDLVAQAVNLGRLTLAAELGKLPEWRPISWAYTKYGRYIVDSYIKLGLVKTFKDGDAQTSRRRINVIELETALMTSNRVACLRHKYGEKADTEFSTK